MSEKSTSVHPKLAISVGECCGVGPEISLKCLADSEVLARCTPLLFGPPNTLRHIASKLDLPCPPTANLNEFESLTAPAIIESGQLDVDHITPGEFNAETGQASYQAVIDSIDAAKQGLVAGIVTGPIQKEAWHAAGIKFPGHTELLAQRTDTDQFCMMLTSEEISCVLATIHIPLADVPAQLSSEGILRAIRLGADALTKRLGRPARVSVCGLNPHAGENGLFSHGEESALIEPAIESARSDGIEVRGPLPPDTAFTPAMRKQTDVFICMYHDQGLIPLKALAFDDAVNVTLGLPIVRTSVDHGTALDIAWQGKASHTSMLAAIHMALDLN